MTEESDNVLSPSRNAGILPSGLIFLNSGVTLIGMTSSRSYEMPFSASATRTLRTNGDALTPYSTGMLHPPSRVGSTPAAGEVGREGVEVFLPVATVLRDPAGRLAHRPERGAAAAEPAVPLAHDQPGVLEHAQMLRDGGQRHGE